MRQNVRLRSFHKIAFLCFVVLGVYYPVLFSPFNQIDDVRIIGHLEDSDPTLLEILFPKVSFYYRPLIFISFYIDKYVWGLEPSFMHLENILIHAANTVLVYLVAQRLAGDDEKTIELPLICSLLFAVHPINTEAVSWVAGRTDPLALLFALLGVFVLLSANGRAVYLKTFISAGFIFVSCLAKEVALFFFPIAYLLALWQGDVATSFKIQSHKTRALALCALPFLLFSLAYLGLRYNALKAGDQSVALLSLHKTTAVAELLISSLKALGFYVKKLFIPLPLNFAIVSYSDWYACLGFVVLVLLCVFLLRHNIYYYALGASVFLILPAVIVAVKNIAWTPVAERYLYCPSAFFVIALAGILFAWFKKRNLEQYLSLPLISLLIFFSYSSVQRNLVWQDNFQLYQNTVQQSPQFAKIRNEYGIALLQKGRNDEAFSQFEAGNKLDKNYYLTTLNLANVKFVEGKNSEAIEILTKTFDSKKNAHPEFLKMLARIYESQMSRSRDERKSKQIARELIDTYQYIYLSTKDPFFAYRGGQLLIYVEEPQHAAILFEKAYNGAPKDAYYREPARKLAEKLRLK